MCVGVRVGVCVGVRVGCKVYSNLVWVLRTDTGRNDMTFRAGFLNGILEVDFVISPGVFIVEGSNILNAM